MNNYTLYIQHTNLYAEKEDNNKSYILKSHDKESSHYYNYWTVLILTKDI